MSHELTGRDELILSVIECLEFMPREELEHGVEVYKISDDPTVSLPSVLVSTGRISDKHMDAVLAVADAKLEAEGRAAGRRVTSADKLDEIAREKDAARERAVAAGAFSARTKKDIKSAWAAYKKKGTAASGEGPVAAPEEGPAPGAEQEPEVQVHPAEKPAFEPVARSKSEPAAPPQAEPPPETKEEPKTPLEAAQRPSLEPVRRSKAEPKMDIPEGKKFVPSWMRKKKERSGEEVPAEPKAEEKPEEKGEDLDKQMESFVARALRSRLHQQVLEALILKRITIIDSHELAKSFGAKEKQVRRVLDDWRASGIVKQLGSHPYTLSPGRKDLELIKAFLKLWTQPAWHAKLLRLILAHESGG